MKQLLTRALHEHNHAVHLARENERLREALALIADLAFASNQTSIARLARNALLGVQPPNPSLVERTT